MTTPSPWTGAVCKLPGCTRSRANFSYYCPYHTSRNTQYGHPLGTTLLPEVYATERKEVRELLESALGNGHSGLAQALKWLDDWQRAGVAGDAPAAALMKRLSDKGITPFAILIEAAAVWVFAQRYPNRLPDDQRLTFAMARCAVRLTPLRNGSGSNWKTRVKFTPKKTDLQAMGERLRGVLGLLFHNVFHSIERKKENEMAFKQSMTVPLA